jgi:hypothetical protein|tara:strand:- start:427 stop:1344 length:918 start_codon:yes stop_codon:yes gene_type:complete
MKKLYKFTISETVTKKVEEKSKDKDGNEVTVTKDSVEVVDRPIFLRKPTRSMFDEAELYYGVQLSEGIKAGLLTRALLAKRFSNDGGVMSNPDKEEYADLYVRLFENQNAIERASAKKEKDRTDAEKEEMTTLLSDNGVIKREIQEFEMAQASLFDQTAENRARNKTILWWVLNMSYYGNPEDNSTVKQIFKGENYAEKLASYDLIEEDGSEFEEEVIKKLVYYVSYWYVGQAQTEEEFTEVLKALEETGAADEAQLAIDEAVEKQKEEKAKTPSKKRSAKKPKQKSKTESPEVEAEVVKDSNNA